MDPKITEYNQIEPLRIFVFPKIDMGNIAQLTVHTVHEKKKKCSFGSYERMFDLLFFFTGKINSVLIPGNSWI